VHFRLVCGATFFGVQLTGWHQFEWQVSVRRPALFTSQMSGKSDRVRHVKVKEWYKYLILKSPPTPSGGHVYKEVSVNANWRMWPVGIVQLPWRKDSFLRSWQPACRPGLRIKCKQIRIIFSLVHRPYKKGTSWLTQSCEKSATLLAKNKASAKGKKHTAVDRQVEIMCIAFTWYTNMGFDKGAWPAMRNSKVMMTMMNFCLLAGFKFEFAKCKWPGKRWGWAEGGISCAVELVQSRWGACLKRDSHSATKAEVKNVILASS